MKHKDVQIQFADSFASTMDVSSKPFLVELSKLNIGYNFLDNYIIHLAEDRNVKWVISRLCDHANGTLHPCDNHLFATCPLHGWKLDLKTLRYCNVDVQKKKINFIIENDNLIIEHKNTHLAFPDNLKKINKASEIKLRFLAHACLLFSCEELNIISDPWLNGPCFSNGWWHDPSPTDDALELLQQADALYLSHNHPDHMHVETLELLVESRPDIPIIIPNFHTKSAERPLKKLGFTNINALAFNQIFRITPGDVYVAILKSGDFRDDSGLYINYGEKQVLITVDSSILNQLVLPNNIDLLATSFTGGASGHPWCFDHYSEKDKKTITENRHKSVKQSIVDHIKACRPKSYMPYAGYFSELAYRDKYIKENNSKITRNEVKTLIEKNFPETIFIDPVATDLITIKETVTAQNSGIKRQKRYTPEIIKQYLNSESTPNESLFLKELTRYFQNSAFSDDLLLFIVPCDDHFNATYQGLNVDFSANVPVIKLFEKEKNILENYNKKSSKLRKLLIRVRASALWDVISNHKSWEELSIGFQCRIHRNPDVYNSKFWYHFSNIYIQ